MIQRCTNPNDVSYPSYGGRGITVCARWLESFENFLADMGIRPEGTSLGRIRNSKSYYPENCEWQTPEQQHENTRQNHYLIHDGQMDTIAGWSRQLGIARSVLSDRIRRGWPREHIFDKRSTIKNPSGFPYVYRDRNRWVARLKIDGKRVDLGYAATPLEAYLLRVKAAAEHGIKLPEGDRFLRKGPESVLSPLPRQAQA